MPVERIQKIMAANGIGSRRSCENLIRQGRVTVNGRTAKLGDKADPQTDTITFDGRTVSKPEKPVYFAVYKPRGILSSAQTEHGRKSVVDLIPAEQRLYPVGRLDIESEGLMLLTNDGELTNLLTHPRYGHQKEYRVLLARHPDKEQLKAWERGVVLEDGYRTQPVEIRIEKLYGKGAWIRLIMAEGRKRQIRETAAQLGLPVVKLIRIGIGSLKLDSLKSGQFRELTPEEVTALKKQSQKK
jgi:23S rRNA pseudouridine2605 synthase